MGRTTNIFYHRNCEINVVIGAVSVEDAKRQIKLIDKAIANALLEVGDQHMPNGDHEVNFLRAPSRTWNEKQ